MSAESLWDVQTGVFTRLTGTAALTALLAHGANSILDHVPGGTDFPYVLISAASCVPSDTQGFSGSEVTLTLDTYSSQTGMQETLTIMAKIYDALHNASFTIPNQVLAQCRCIDTSTAVEADGHGGEVRHGTQHFRLITEPA